MESPKASHTPVELAGITCNSQYADTLSGLYELGRALKEGTTLTDYGLWIKSTSDDLEKVDTSGLDGTCLISVGATVRTILNDHMDARDAWRACAAQKTSAKFNSCFDNDVRPIWTDRTNADYTSLFGAMGSLYLDQIALLRPEWIPHAAQ